MKNNPVLDCLMKRSSVRIFTEEPLSEEEENIILEAAMRAPTAAKLQLYSIIVVRDKETKAKLAETCNHQPWLAKTPFLLIFCADYQRVYDFYDGSGAREKAEKLGIEYVRPGEQYLLLATVDASIAAENAVIAGESIGVGSCFVGHIMDYYEIHKEMFNLPDYVYPISILAMGHTGVKASKPSPRCPREFIVHEEKYRRFSPEELDRCYSFFPEPPVPNRFDAENRGQYHFLSRHSSSGCYQEGIRSVREALKNWDYGKQD